MGRAAVLAGYHCSSPQDSDTGWGTRPGANPSDRCSDVFIITLPGSVPDWACAQFSFTSEWDLPGKLLSSSYKSTYGRPTLLFARLTEILPPSDCPYIFQVSLGLFFFPICHHSVQLSYNRIWNIQPVWKFLKWQNTLMRDSTSYSLTYSICAVMFQKLVIRINLFGG